MEINKFLNYCENSRNGIIKFPIENEYDNNKMRIPIGKFYSVLKYYVMDLKKIDAIIIFGSAIKENNYEIVNKKRRKYIFFGEEIRYKKRVLIYPGDIDFLIVTKNRMFNEKHIESDYEMESDGSCVYTSLVSSGIDLINRSLNDLKNEVSLFDNDTICETAYDGVILCCKSSFPLKNKIKNNNIQIKYDDSNLNFNIDITFKELNNVK